MNTMPVKGMRDFYPEDLVVRNWLFDHFRQSARLFNFREYDPCLLESEELFVRKEGDEITGQLYNFEDKGNRRVALRPEITPSLAHMVVGRQKALAMPLRWYTIGQCFRYEKMQKGRKREHYQWNMDIVGDDTLMAEVEILSAAAHLFRSIGLSEADVVIRFSSRALLAEFLSNAGIPEGEFAEVCVVLDKLSKIGTDGVSSMLCELGYSDTLIKSTLGFVGATGVDEICRLCGERLPAAESVEQLRFLADEAGIGGFLEFTPSLVRGLSYYTGTVFEGFERSVEGRSIFGGGRYDRLIEVYGGQPAPMVGFGFGDVVIFDVLRERRLLPDLQYGTKVMVVAYSSSEISAAASIVSQLRINEVVSELDGSFRRISKTFSRAAKEGFSHVILVAPDELQSGNVKIKDLKTGSERQVPLDQCVEAMM